MAKQLAAVQKRWFCALVERKRCSAFFLAALLVAGCGSTPRRPERTPLPASIVSVTGTQTSSGQSPRERIVDIALGEWRYWGAQRVHIDLEGTSCVTSSPLIVPQPEITEWQIHDSMNERYDVVPVIVDEPQDCVQFPDGTGMEATSLGCERAQLYWGIVGKRPDCEQVTTGAWAWSAVFISWVMRQARIDASRFLTSEAHSEYIVDVRDGLLDDPLFEIVPTPAVPRAGDIICMTRANAWLLESVNEILSRRTPMHCDIVVDIDPEEKIVWTIGGNVQQSVSMSAIDLLPDGRLASDPGSPRPWRLILRNRAP